MNDQINQPEKLTYYHTLKHYKPMCYSGKGVPFLLAHDTYTRSIPCVIIINAVIILVLILSAYSLHQTADYQFRQILIKISILILVLINVSYFLTVFMNPGIVSQEDLKLQEGEILKYCDKCSRKTANMAHCIECEVCVEDMDHHCGFFGKCIAGKQRFAFYGFILFMFCGFIVLLAGASMSLN